MAYETAKAAKEALRRQCLARRDSLTPEERLSFSTTLCRHALEGLSLAASDTMSGYYPIRSEADIRPLLESLRQGGQAICLPVVLDRETIAFRLWPVGAELVNTGFGTRGPGPELAEVDPDVLLMPLAGFDCQGNRIGYGAGHYDRAIARLNAKGLKPRLIGIAFDCQEVEAVPAEPHDVPLDAVVTESGVRLLTSRS
ncbi:5-formyltetrahydrofolate cyclo-ligase [Rhizobium paknamense]|uniref:5-formyltetrahydrofolate cyclo-ligase n=1 Tax=Rhizobium paknamense TaxID=1206817 RepID=A0ABU0IHD1_9HYPH|nr:5-formyltetrahydrofolate cyclo-ligase [Rhizobium paknamense]MDQ0457043.1 5-formyltetrahydrofolate cyclo-ligase [Rhizobium paknamense]